MSTSENRFYVYEHLRSDTGAVFYVGKGTATKNAKGHLSHLVGAFKQKLNAHTVGKLAEMQCVDGILKIARRNHDPD